MVPKAWHNILGYLSRERGSGREIRGEGDGRSGVGRGEGRGKVDRHGDTRRGIKQAKWKEDW